MARLASDSSTTRSAVRRSRGVGSILRTFGYPGISPRGTASSPPDRTRHAHARAQARSHSGRATDSRRSAAPSRTTVSARRAPPRPLPLRATSVLFEASLFMDAMPLFVACCSRARARTGHRGTRPHRAGESISTASARKPQARRPAPRSAHRPCKSRQHKSQGRGRCPSRRRLPASGGRPPRRPGRSHPRGPRRRLLRRRSPTRRRRRA